jgi:hypothetical protein
MDLSPIFKILESLGDKAGENHSLDTPRRAAAHRSGALPPDRPWMPSPRTFGVCYSPEHDARAEEPWGHAVTRAAFRDRDSIQPMRVYDGFLALLVVTGNYSAEARSAGQPHMAGQQSTMPLAAICTPTGPFNAPADAILGPSCCSPGPEPLTTDQTRIRRLRGLELRRPRPDRRPTVRPSSVSAQAEFTFGSESSIAPCSLSYETRLVGKPGRASRLDHLSKVTLGRTPVEAPDRHPDPIR